MQMFADHFDPNQVTMAPGDSIAWVNKDTAGHELCFGDPNADEPDFCDDIAAGATSPAHTLNAPGDYAAVVCTDDDCNDVFFGRVSVKGGDTSSSSTTTVDSTPKSLPRTDDTATTAPAPRPVTPRPAARPTKVAAASSTRTTRTTIAATTTTAEPTTTTTTEPATTTTSPPVFTPTSIGQFAIREASHHQSQAPVVFAATLGVIAILASAVYSVERPHDPMR